MSAGKDKAVLVLAMLTVFCVGGGTALCMNQSAQLKTVRLKLKETQNQVRNEGDVQAELDTITAKVTDSKEQLSHLEQGVPPLAYVPTMMAELENIGKTNGITVTGVRPLPTKAPPPPKKTEDGEAPAAPVRKPYEEQDIEVKGSGEYLKVLAFLSSLESFPKIVSVQQVTLSPKDENKAKSGTPNLDITVVLRAFLFRNDAPMSASTASLMTGENHG